MSARYEAARGAVLAARAARLLVDPRASLTLATLAYAVRRLAEAVEQLARAVADE